MRYILLPLLLCFFIACQSDELALLETEQDQSASIEDENFARGGNGNAFGKLRNCASHKVLQRNLKQTPALARKLQRIEAQTSDYLKVKKAREKPKKGKGPQPKPATQTYTIPVYIHVLYNHEQENISITQIQSQIDVLNADFNARNREIGSKAFPNEFAPAIANTNISFTWSTANITRKRSSRATWDTSDEMKFAAQGGIDAVTPDLFLNIWICNLGNGVLGYAQFPGGGALQTDGVVIGTPYFGTTGYVQAPFDKGRTATHEIGHWLNLRHIWGDGDCNMDDYVADTPASDRPNYGCTAYPTSHCSSNDMSMNFMDYNDDACMYMFTNGQRDRMHALLTSGGARERIARQR